MTYDVLKEHIDDDFKVADPEKPYGPKVSLHLVPGGSFIPAMYNYPTKKVEALVLDGTLKLREKPAHEKTSAKRK